MYKLSAVILVGGFVEIIELCEDNDISIVGVIDQSSKDIEPDLKYLGTDDDVSKLLSQINNIPLIITPDNPKIRQKLYLYYSGFGLSFATIISKKAVVSNSAILGIGNVIQASVNISSKVRTGKFVKINSQANLMHHCSVGDFTTIAPNAVLLGRVTIGNNCYIGANSTILPNVSICDNVMIGAGSVVTKDINIPNTTFLGIPAKQKVIKNGSLKKNKSKT